MANIYEHQFYLPVPDDPTRVGKLQWPMLTTQPIMVISDPFFRGSAMFHCAACGDWMKNRCGASDPNECLCLEINMINHVRGHGGDAYRDMVKAALEVVSPRLRDFLIEQVPGLQDHIGGDKDWDISELTKDVPPDPPSA